MGDPLSIAGSALGIVSLGLTVCQGLATYYQHWIDYDSNLDGVGQRVKDILESLRVLEAILRKVNNANLTTSTSTRSSVQACRSATKKLEALLQECRAVKVPNSQTSRAKVKATLQHALYPFRKRTMDEIQHSISQLHDSLLLALSTMNMELLDEVKRIGSQSHSTILQSQQKLDGVYDAVHDMQATMTLAQADHANTKQTLDGIASQGKQTAHALSQMWSQQGITMQRLDVLSPTIQTGFDRMLQSSAGLQARSDQQHEEILQALTRLMSKPNYLHSVCNLAPGLNAEAKRLSQRCTCIHTRQGRHVREAVSGMRTFDLTNNPHRKSCPLFRSEDDTHVKVLEMALLPYAIRLSLESRRGAGAFSLGPVFSFCRFARISSPAFSVVKAMGEQISLVFENRGFGVGDYMSEIEDVMQYAIFRLQQVFDKREALPTETLPDGSTVLHASMEVTIYFLMRYPNFGRLISSLILQLADLGVPLNDTDSEGSTASGRFAWRLVPHMNYQEQSRCLDALVDSGALILGSPSSGTRGNLDWVGVDARLGIPLIDALDQGDLSNAILDQSEGQMRTILEENPASANEQNSLLQTPLHLAVTWPLGMRALLAAGADPNQKDVNGATPLSYACWYAHMETIRILCDADSRITHVDWDWPIEVFEHVVRALVNRRKRLQKLASQHLDPENLAAFELNDDRILDSTALPIYQALVRHDVYIPPALEVTRGGTQYDQLARMRGDDLVAKADLMFGHGFRDINQIQWASTSWGRAARSPEDCRRRVLRWRWLVEKGLDLGRMSFGAMTSYYILRSLLQVHFRPWETVSSFQHGALDRPGSAELIIKLFEVHCGLEILQLIAIHKGRDLCRCHCAKGGCSTISLMIKILRCELGQNASCDMIAEALRSALQLEENSKHQFEITNAIIRYEAFSMLRLSHVCCHFIAPLFKWIGARQPFDDSETEEIKEEEHDLIADLESIVEHLEAKYLEVGGPLASFMRGYMADHMNEYFKNKSVQDLEERQRIIELGVILHD